MARRQAKQRYDRPVFDAQAAGAQCDVCPLAKDHKPLSPPGHKIYPGRASLIIIQDAPSSYECERGVHLDTSANRILDRALSYTQSGKVYKTYACLCDTKGATDKELESAVLACKPRLERELSILQEGSRSDSSDRVWGLLLGDLAWQSIAANTHGTNGAAWHGSPIIQTNQTTRELSHFIATRSPGEIISKAGRRHTGNWIKHIERVSMLADGRLEAFEWPEIVVDNCEEALRRVLQAIRSGCSWGFDIETNGLSKDSVVSCMAISIQNLAVCVQFPCSKEEKNLLEAILLESGMVGQNIGYFDRPLLENQGWKLNTWFDDTLFAASILDPQQPKDLHSLTTAEFHSEAWKSAFKTDTESGVLQGDVWGSSDPKVARDRREYCAKDAYASLLLWVIQKARLNDTPQQKIYRDLLFQYDVSMEMRRTGIGWNFEAADRLRDEWTKKKVDALLAARALAVRAGEEFAELNPGSSLQLRKLFFQRCGLAPTHWTDKNAASTGYDALMAIKKQKDNAFAAEIAQLVLDYRDAEKMLGTYIIGMAPAEGQTQGQTQGQTRCFGDWKVHSTVSGRWSCTGVPLQTLSATTRELFIASPGNVFIECDLSSAEGRTIALLAKSEKLLNIFSENADVYSIIGTQMFGQKVQKGDKLRQLAKTSFLSLNYGAQPDTAYDMFWAQEEIRKAFPGLTVRDVEAIRNKYMKVLPEVFEWSLQEKKDSQKRGYYFCPWNERRMTFYGPAELTFAANFPNQAGVAWWMCNTLRKVWPGLSDYEAEIRTQVHDSLTVECSERFGQELAEVLQNEMQGTLTLNGCSIKMLAEYKIGRTLRDVK